MASKAYALLQMKDTFYQEFQIPALPLPLSMDDLDKGLKGSFPFKLISDNLLIYLAEHPQDSDAYAPVLARMAYEAGVSAGRQQQFEVANRYFEIARQAEPGNATILANLGRSYYDIGDLFNAAAAHQAAVTAYGTNFTPDTWLMLAKILYEMGEVKAGRAAVDDYLARLELLAPEHYAEIKGYGRQWCLHFKADPAMTALLE